MLKKVAIKNFRSCIDTEFALKGNICALVGKNGAGKTNVLKAIEWLATTAITPKPIQSADKESSVNLWFDLNKIKYCYSVNRPLLSLAGERPAVSDQRESLQSAERGGEFFDVFRRQGEVITVNLRRSRRDPVRIGNQVPALAALLALMPNDDPVRIPVSITTEFLRGIRYYAEEDVSADEDILLPQDYMRWEREYEVDQSLTHSIAKRLTYIWKKDTELFKEFKTLVGPNGLGLLEDVFPREIPVGVEREQPVEYFIFWRFTPSKNIGGTGIPFTFSDLSSGTRRIIRYLISILFDKRSLMLIEEPEDSIHPGMLIKLIDVFRSYSHRSQVIFTTHSPEVLNFLKPEEVLLTTAEDGGTKVRPLSLAELKRAKKFLKDAGPLSEFLEVLED